MKLKAKLMMLYSFCAICIILILGSIFYILIWNVRLRSIKEDVSNQLLHIDFALNVFFYELENDVNTLALTETVRSKNDNNFTNFLNADEKTFIYNIQNDEQKIIDIFNNYRNTHIYVNSVYMGRENGSFVRSHKREKPTKYDPGARPWYILAKNNPDKVMMTDAYSSVTTADVNIGIVKALVDTQGAFYGVVGVDITLVNLTNYISKLKINPDGKIILTDKSGIVLAGLDTEFFFKSIESYSFGIIKILNESNQGFAAVKIKNQKNYLFFDNSTKLDLKILALIPSVNIEKEIIRQILVAVIGILSALIFMSFFTLNWLNIYILRPLNNFIKETRYIAETSNIESRININSQDEIGVLASSYNQMINTLSLAEADLRRSEKKYHEIFENAVMGIFQSSPAGVYLSVNPAFAQICGYKTPEEMIRDIKDITHEVYVNPEDRLRFMNLLEKEGIVKDFQAEFRRRDGSKFWISINGKPIRNDLGNILYYEGTVEEITNRMHAEKELAKYREDLETMVSKRTAELEVAKERAEAADKLKSAFLATMSHELRTPLNSIIGFTGIILQEMVGALNDEQKKQLNMVQGSAHHLFALINDILDISKIEAGQLQLISETYNLHQTIKKVVKSAQILADKKGIEISYNISPEIENIIGDKRRFEQILINLINNAIKFSEKGSVKINCGLKDEKLYLSVIDSGIGIKTEDMDKIFKAFRQIDSGLTRKYEGTGLGLSICKKLVEMMGGNIWATSIWGEGSTFIFTLPYERKDK